MRAVVCSLKLRVNKIYNNAVIVHCSERNIMSEDINPTTTPPTTPPATPSVETKTIEEKPAAPESK